MSWARVMTRAPRACRSLRSVKGCRKWALSRAWISWVSTAVCIFESRFKRAGVVQGGGSDMEQQVLTFPGRNHFHELVKLQLLDLGVARADLLAQHFVQVGFLAQPVQRLGQTARQCICAEIGVALHLRLGLDLVHDPQIAAS